MIKIRPTACLVKHAISYLLFSQHEFSYLANCHQEKLNVRKIVPVCVDYTGGVCPHLKLDGYTVFGGHADDFTIPIFS